jgi:hypothetical protein
MSTPSVHPFTFEEPVTYEEINDCLPSVLRALAAKAEDVFGLSPSTIAAAGLAHLAAAIGRSTLLDDGTAVTAPGYNFVAVSDDRCSADWLSAMGRGWTDNAASLRGLESKPIACASRRPWVGAKDRRSTEKPEAGEPLDKQPLEQMGATINSIVLKDALVRSPDNAVALIQGADDPMFEWTRLKPGMQHNLSSLLSLSWQGRLLKTGPRDPSIKGSLTCLWQAQCAEIRHAWNHPSKSSKDSVPPFLLFSTKGKARRFPTQDASELAAWKQHVQTAFVHRLSRPAAVFPMIFVAQAEDFSRQLMKAVQSCPAQMEPWLHWTSGLLPRIINLLIHDKLLAMSQTPPNHSQKGPNDEKQKSYQQLMRQSLMLTTWLLQSHHKTVQKILSQPGRQPSDNPDGTDNIGLSESIMRRLHDQGPLSRRELQRSFHQMSAQQRDKAVARLKSTGQVVETEDGKLALPA